MLYGGTQVTITILQIFPKFPLLCCHKNISNLCKIYLNWVNYLFNAPHKETYTSNMNTLVYT